MKPFFQTKQVTLYQGEMLPVLQSIESNSVDAVITDPPYCSGAAMQSAKNADPVTKYCQDNNARGRPSFKGDSKDQRSFFRWCADWLRECRRITREGGYLIVSIDWRMLPTMTDAVQSADWTWRGIVPWDKGLGSRSPHKGYFRHQCEYWVWATNGPCRNRTDAGPFPGCIREPILQRDKHHITGKPTAVMTQLVRVVPGGGTVLDPFAGSGTTLVAAASSGRNGIGIERELPYCNITKQRIEGITQD